MKNENIVIKGIIQKNKMARYLIIAGIVLLIISFTVVSFVYEDGEGYLSYGYGFSGHYYWRSIYDDNFVNFFSNEFFNPDCYYGYIMLLGFIVLFAGIIVKSSTEKCEITVTNNSIVGKIPHGQEANIPLNQVTALNRSSFNGISVSSIGKVSNFYCIQNQNDVYFAITDLIANLQGTVLTTDASTASTSSASSADDVERLIKLKELLDSGVLTQEEFDVKKKQILGL